MKSIISFWSDCDLELFFVSFTHSYDLYVSFGIILWHKIMINVKTCWLKALKRSRRTSSACFPSTSLSAGRRPSSLLIYSTAVSDDQSVKAFKPLWVVEFWCVFCWCVFSSVRSGAVPCGERDELVCGGGVDVAECEPQRQCASLQTAVNWTEWHSV